MSGSITASRYTNALRYNPFRLSTGRYPGMPPTSAVPSLPVTETPIGAYPQAPVVDAAAPPPAAPAAETPVYSGAAPVDWRPDNGEGGGVGSGGAGDPFSGNYGGLGDNSLGGMPGPSPDQSIGGLLGALHHATYDRLMDRWVAAQDALDGDMMRSLERLKVLDR